jgi:hypothetical protein
VDEGGDPTCLDCARAADLEAGRDPLVEVLVLAVPDGPSARTPAWVPQVAALVGVEREAAELSGAAGTTFVRDAATGWLRARGWDTVHTRKGLAPLWRHALRPRGYAPVSLLRAVLAEHTRPTRRAQGAA